MPSVSLNWSSSRTVRIRREALDRCGRHSAARRSAPNHDSARHGNCRIGHVFGFSRHTPSPFGRDVRGDGRTAATRAIFTDHNRGSRRSTAASGCGSRRRGHRVSVPHRRHPASLGAAGEVNTVASVAVLRRRSQVGRHPPEERAALGSTPSDAIRPSGRTTAQLTNSSRNRKPPPATHAHRTHPSLQATAGPVTCGLHRVQTTLSGSQTDADNETSSVQPR